jgi:hypothetical protein
MVKDRLLVVFPLKGHNKTIDAAIGKHFKVKTSLSKKSQ